MTSSDSMVDLYQVQDVGSCHQQQQAKTAVSFQDESSDSFREHSRVAVYFQEDSGDSRQEDGQPDLYLKDDSQISNSHYEGVRTPNSFQRKPPSVSAGDRRRYQEVGSVPGTYRIIDLYCLKEVLNQIMRCSCESDQGFAIFQGLPEPGSLTFHSILDILCNNCKRKICFGTSILRNQLGANNEPEVDIRLDSVIGDTEVKRDLWNEFYKSSSLDLEDTIVLNSTRVGIDESDVRFPLPHSSQEVGREGEEMDDVTKLRSASVQVPKYQCHVCSKLFKKQYNLQEHMRIHTGDAVPCTQEGCTEKFNDKSTMNKHVKAVHLKEKPYPCDICGKKFSRREHLKHHYVIHTGEKKFSCDVCNKSFSFQSTLQKHKLTHTATEMIKCSFCWKQFKTEFSVKKHINKFHPLNINTQK